LSVTSEVRSSLQQSIFVNIETSEASKTAENVFEKEFYIRNGRVKIESI